MTDTELILQRPLTAKRFWFIAPGEPRDWETLKRLVGLAVIEARDGLLIDPVAAKILAAIGRTGREGICRRLDHYICECVGARLSGSVERQPVKAATIEYYGVPVPSEHRVCGTLIVRAWSHTIRTTLDCELLK